VEHDLIASKQASQMVRQSLLDLKQKMGDLKREKEAYRS